MVLFSGCSFFGLPSIRMSIQPPKTSNCVHRCCPNLVKSHKPKPNFYYIYNAIVRLSLPAGEPPSQKCTMPTAFVWWRPIQMRKASRKTIYHPFAFLDKKIWTTRQWKHCFITFAIQLVDLSCAVIMPPCERNNNIPPTREQSIPRACIFSCGFNSILITV